jgi:hypothetical protein
LVTIRSSPVAKAFKRGRVRGVILRKVVSNIRFKGYVHHASRKEPQYLIKSEKTEHVAIHKGHALRHVKARAQRSQQKTGEKKT